MWVGMSRSPAKLSNREAAAPIPARRRTVRARLQGHLVKEESQLRDGRYLLAYGYRTNKSTDA